MRTGSVFVVNDDPQIRPVMRATLLNGFSPAGLLAGIGHYRLVIQERDEEQKEFDYTLIPLRAKTAVRYT